MVNPDATQRVGECAQAVMMAAMQAMTVDGKVDLPSLVTGCARMGGRYQLRRQGLDLSHTRPGEAVLWPAAGPHTDQLVRFCATALQSFGTTLPDAPPEPIDTLRQRVRHDFLQSQATLEPVLAPLQAQHGLDDEQMAKAVATATAALIHQLARYLAPAAGFGFAVYGFTEGLRTVPAPAAP